MGKCIRLSNIDCARKIEVIEVASIRGEGTQEDPVEQIIEYFLLDGTRLARVGMYDKVEEIIKWEKQTTKEVQE